MIDHYDMADTDTGPTGEPLHLTRDCRVTLCKKPVLVWYPFDPGAASQYGLCDICVREGRGVTRPKMRRGMYRHAGHH
jgi:hypothetical protein